MVQANAPGNGGLGGNGNGGNNPFNNFPLGLTGMMEISKQDNDSDKKKRRLFLRDVAQGDPLWFLFMEAGAICHRCAADWQVLVSLEDVQVTKANVRKMFHRDGIGNAELQQRQTYRKRGI